MTGLVRIATRDDEEEIVRLLHLMHEEGGILPLDIEKSRKTFAMAFDRKGGIIGVIGDKGDIRAMIFVLMVCHWYTSEYHLEELCNFVRPDHRKSNYANVLIESAKDWAEQLKMPLLIGVMTSNRMAAKVRLYRMRLGPPAGAYFIWNAHFGGAVQPSTENFWSSIESRSERRQRERRDKWATKQGQLGFDRKLT